MLVCGYVPAAGAWGNARALRDDGARTVSQEAATRGVECLRLIYGRIREKEEQLTY